MCVCGGEGGKNKKCVCVGGRGVRNKKCVCGCVCVGGEVRTRNVCVCMCVGGKNKKCVCVWGGGENKKCVCVWVASRPAVCYLKERLVKFQCSTHSMVQKFLGSVIAHKGPHKVYYP